jgi:hypothetical protein
MRQRTGGWWFEASWDKQFTRAYLKNIPTQNRADGVAPVIEHLPTKCEALSSNTSTLREKKIRSENIIFRYNEKYLPFSLLLYSS